MNFDNIKNYYIDDKYLDIRRKIIYFMFIVAICFFFLDIDSNLKTMDLMERDYNKNEDNSNLKDFDLKLNDVTEIVETKYNYNYYIRNIVFDILQIIFLVMVMIIIYIHEQLQGYNGIRKY